MHITPKQMQRRIEIAEGIEHAMLFVFAYWLIYADLGMSLGDMKKLTRNQLQAVYERYTKLDGYIESRLDNISNEIIDATEKNTSADSSGELPTSYWTSPDRAKIIAENEANAFENYNDYKAAKANGCTKKRWLTENDERVRLTHELAEGQTVDIDGLFSVGGCEMRFPMDTLYDPDPAEIINCRCACVYE